MTLLPQKYQNLQIAEKSGIKTPMTLFLSEEELLNKKIDQKVNDFLYPKGLPGLPSEYFIVRSCVSAEDDADKSFAGHFHSSEQVTRKELTETIEAYFQKNKTTQTQLAPEGQTHLMVQAFIEADFGGVVFSPWKYFYHHFLVEMTQGGAQKSVEGRESQFFCLSSEEGMEDILNYKIEDEHSNAPLQEECLKKLKLVVHNLKKIFDFPFDMEWAQDKKGEIYVLQVRPITKTITALLPANTEQIQKQQDRLQALAPGKWRQSALSESLGHLSPLSFSLFQVLYERSKSTFQRLGFRAQDSDFLTRLPNGQILVGEKKEHDFFSWKSFLGPFRQKAQEPKLKREVCSFCEKLSMKDGFEFDRLSAIFNWWQVANVYFSSQNQISEDLVYRENEYEVSVMHNVECLIWNKKEFKTWESIRNFLKTTFLSELDKVKREVQKNPDWAFLTSQIFI